MLKLRFDENHGGSRKILCFGAHADDIEIGCGGTLIRLCKEHENIEIYWTVFAAPGQRAVEARESAALFLADARSSTVVVKDFKDGFFPFRGDEIKQYFEELKHVFSPDIVFTHYRNDLHQDHRFVSDLTWNTFRDHLILEYEVVKYDGDFGAPNFFVHLNEETCKQKIEYIMRSFKSQDSKDWFTDDTFLSILRLRGVESKALARYAEAYYCRKMVL